MLASKKIDVSGIEIVNGGKTFFWSGKYHNDLNTRDTLDTQLNVLADFNPVVPKNYIDAEVLMLGNLHPSIQLSVIEQMMKRPKLIVLDTMNFWMNHTWDELLEVIAKVDIITINDEEARQLTGEYSLLKAAQKSILWDQLMWLSKKENTELYYFIMTMSFLLQPFHLKKFLTQQEQETHLLEASLDTLQKQMIFPLKT